MPRTKGSKNIETMSRFKKEVGITSCYCRKCMRQRPTGAFYKATDFELDTNGYMSVCKDCIETMYENIYKNEGSIEKAIYRLCKMLNIIYKEEAIEAAKNHLNTLMIKSDNTSESGIFGLYRMKIVSTISHAFGEKAEGDLRFVYSGIPISNTPVDETDDILYLKKVWGDGFSVSDYRYLEEEFSEWKKTHKCDTRAEEILLREIVMKQLDIRKARVEGRSVDTMVKNLQDLMKTASYDPSKASAANSGKSQDTYGNFIRMIEETTPAEFYKDKELFKDFDGIQKYFKNYVYRSIKNFLLGSRDFNISESEEITDEFDFPNDDKPTEEQSDGKKDSV